METPSPPTMYQAYTGKIRSCHLSFGLIADVQYADMDDGTNFNKARKRYYRASLDALKRAVAAWKTNTELAFVVQLGDLLDGLNKRINGATAAALEAVLAPFRELSCPTYHLVGNHDLYNLSRSEILTSELNSGRLLGSNGVKGELYYSVVVHPRLRLIVLDTYDIGVLGYCDRPHHPHYLEAQRVLEENNPNPEKNSAVGLTDVAQRYVAYNGGVSKLQLSWLEAQLSEADAHRQNVIITAHCQLNAALNDTVEAGACLVWNYTEVQKVLHSHNCVIGCFMGHDHNGSLTVDSAGIQHLVLKGVIETPPGTDAYATAFLTDTTLEIEGAGAIPSILLPLKYLVDTQSNSLISNGVEVLSVA